MGRKGAQPLHHVERAAHGVGLHALCNRLKIKAELSESRSHALGPVSARPMLRKDIAATSACAPAAPKANVSVAASSHAR